MGRIAASFISQNTSRKLSQRRLIWIGIVLGVMISTSTLMSHILIWQIESRLKVHIENTPRIFFLPGIITVRNAKVRYENQFQLEAKKISAVYLPWGFITLSVPVHISGSGATIPVNAALQAFQHNGSTQKDISVGRVSADLIVHLGQGVEVQSLDIDSDLIQFHLGPREAGKEIEKAVPGA